MLANTYRRQPHERALDQYGYVTTRDAAALGIPPVELRKLAERGGLTHVARGVFRFDDLPHTGREPFMKAVLRVGDGAFLTSDAVLALHDLGLVNPRRIRVGTPDRVRAALPRPWRWSAGTSNPLSSPRSRAFPPRRSPGRCLTPGGS